MRAQRAQIPISPVFARVTRASHTRVIWDSALAALETAENLALTAFATHAAATDGPRGHGGRCHIDVDGAHPPRSPPLYARTRDGRAVGPAGSRQAAEERPRLLGRLQRAQGASAAMV